MRDLPKQSAKALVALAFLAASLAGCSASLPEPTTGSTVAPNLLLSGMNSNAVAGSPRTVYERMARQATKCWFGPFGSEHQRYMTSADVPAPATGKPVTMTVHRRLAELKRPWGPALMRIELSGQSTTTLSFTNVGLAPPIMAQMTSGLTQWANGGTDCPHLHDAAPKPAAEAIAAPPAAAKRRKR